MILRRFIRAGGGIYFEMECRRFTPGFYLKKINGFSEHVSFHCFLGFGFFTLFAISDLTFIPSIGPGDRHSFVKWLWCTVVFDGFSMILSFFFAQVDTNCDGKLEVGDFIHTIIRSPAPAGLSSYQDTVRVLKATKSLSTRLMKYEEMRKEVTKQYSLFEKILNFTSVIEC